jgi:hypothetical protein
MAVIVLGANGSIGRRYCAILKYLKIPFDVYDSQEFWKPTDNFSHVIVATPTDTHGEYVKRLAESGHWSLIEKPLTKDRQELEELKKHQDSERIFSVCNLRYTCLNFQKPVTIEYDFYNTGKDGTVWDCIQLFYMDKQAKIRTNSPFLKFRINHVSITHRMVEESYIKMLQDFLSYKTKNLWSMKDAVKMCEETFKRVGM